MASTSFNPIQLQQTQNTTAQALTLKQGQVFHGTVKQLYPDQMAEIQVGGNRFFAKLEVPLKAGDAHYFQVTNMNPQTELKVVTSPMQQGTTAGQQIQQLLDTMNLPKTPEMQQVLRHFLREQVPISKDQLVAAEQWMKNLPDGVTKQDALSALQRMSEMKMPFTIDVFQALVFGQKTSGMTASINVLAQLLENDTSLPIEIKNNLLQQIQQLAKPFDLETGGLMLARAVQALANGSSQLGDQIQVLNLLKGASILPEQANIQNALILGQTAPRSSNPVTNVPEQANVQNALSLEPTAPAISQTRNIMHQAGQVIQTIMSTQPEQASQLAEQLKSWVQNQNLLSDEQKNQLQQLINRFAQIPPSKQAIEVLAQQMHEQLVKAFADQVPNQVFAQDSNGLSAKEHLLSLIQPDKAEALQQEQFFRNVTRASNDSPQQAIQHMLTQAEDTIQSAINGKAMEHVMKGLLKDLGISYEAALSNNSNEPQALAQSLKPQLMQLLQETQTSTPLRESAEVLLARMNGMQLLSGENGHQHQIIMQVPLQFLGKQMDASLQWNGRMKEDGKLDSAYARILFYLQMESMQETVIDMQVQNRIVTVTIFNEAAEQLKPLSELLSATLQAGLAEKEYHLSGIVLKSFEKPAEAKSAKASNNHNDQQSGVDIRI